MLTTLSEIDHTSVAHNEFFEELRKTEYSRLDAQNHVYLDYTGGNMYADSHLKEHFDLISKNVFGNPHSTNPTSQLATKLIESTRKKVLDFFNANDYFCVFTQNASGALKIVGECYPFSDQSKFLLFSDNHNSVNGIREYCHKRGGDFNYVPLHYENLKVDEAYLNDALNAYPDAENKLFAFPAQSNVSGVKHSLDWIEKAADLGWDVLLDAAAYVPTSKLDLSKVKPDFVSISFYKIFGYPTGLGCLLVKKSKFNKLQKPWFAGGTVTLAAVRTPEFRLHENHERFENGTLNYLDLPALKTGFEFIERIGMQRIAERVGSLRDYLYAELKDLTHENGTHQLKLFGPSDKNETGGTLIMTFFNPDGSKIPFESIEEKANEKMISIRSGCFCNPGIDEVNNCVTSEELAKFFTNLVNGDYRDMNKFLHKMRGATRVSVGLATTKKDLNIFIDFVKSMQNKTIA